MSGVARHKTSQPSDDYEKHNSEWEKCREAADKFDGILVDLRKYGFTILTGLTTAGSFLGYSAPTRSIQIGVIVVTMALIMVLYWLDIYYQSLLNGASFRARFLELFRLKKYRQLSLYISGFYVLSHTGQILHILYFGFLAALFILGLFASGFLTSIGSTALNRELVTSFLVLTGAFVFTALLMLTVYVRCDMSNQLGVNKIRELVKKAERQVDTLDSTDAANCLEEDILHYFMKVFRVRS